MKFSRLFVSAVPCSHPSMVEEDWLEDDSGWHDERDKGWQDKMNSRRKRVVLRPGSSAKKAKSSESSSDDE